MEYYLVRLSYTPAAWGELIRTATTLEARLEPVRRLLRHLGGSLPRHTFFHAEPPSSEQPPGGQLSGGQPPSEPTPSGKQPPIHLDGKFAMLSGHDLLTVLALPDKHAAHAFHMALSAEPGLSAVDLAQVVPWGEVIENMGKVRSALEATGYAAPARGGEGTRAGGESR